MAKLLRGEVVKYRTIVADPPWQYVKDKLAARNKMARWSEAYYPTMTMREIAELPVANLAADKAHLYLWITNPRLYGDRNDFSFNPAQLMKAWGFEYRTTLTWVKQGAPGMGNYFRVNTEHVLFGIRGSCQIEPSNRRSNVIVAPRGSKHSAKPESFLDLVEQVSPGPYLELFARRNRFGWDTWGNEALRNMELVP